MTLPLTGVTVLDLTHAAAGPLATLIMASLGAAVIKIEHPRRGDGARYMGEPMFGGDRSDYFVGLNHSKKSVALNLKEPEAQRLALELARDCQVVIENFRPGVMDRMGLGFEHVRAVNPRAVYCSISGFGPSGPWRSKPANDIVIQSLSGLMAITGEEGGDPVKIGAPVCDYVAGLYAVIGVLAALRTADDTAQGQHVHVPMLDSALSLLSNFVPATVDRRVPIRRMGSAHPQLVPYQAFRCQDDEFLLVGAFTDAFWRRLAVAIGHPKWAEDERFETNERRLKHRDLLVGQLSEVFRTRPRDEWAAVLDEADVPNGPVLTPIEALTSEQAADSGVLEALSYSGMTAHVARMPVRSSSWGRPAATGFPPRLGEHTTEVLTARLGVPASELARLAAEGIVGS
jgi:crotonobetainyl-CoA:carnitine CoA-transferase CaiB-like acyl-CoA transferase